jgi:hypothetical protein
LGKQAGTWGAERPSTRSPYASPPAYEFNGTLTAGRPETGERTRANGSAG